MDDSSCICLPSRDLCTLTPAQEDIEGSKTDPRREAVDRENISELPIITIIQVSLKKIFSNNTLEFAAPFSDDESQASSLPTYVKKAHAYNRKHAPQAYGNFIKVLYLQIS